MLNSACYYTSYFYMKLVSHRSFIASYIRLAGSLFWE